MTQLCTGGGVGDSDVEDGATATSGRGNAEDEWKPLIIVAPHRLGLNGVNPVYHDGIKAIFGFPQSLGIIGTGWGSQESRGGM